MLYVTISNSFSSPLESATVGGVQSETPRIYTIYNISLDETASTSTRAREIALNKAQHIALEKLLRKILRRKDYETLPELGDNQISDLVSGLEIAHEKSSSVRYLADFTVHFSRDKIYNFLLARGLPFAETLSMPVSILAVLEKDGVTILWEKSNDWREAWIKYDTLNNLVPVRVIEASLANRMAITPRQARLGDKPALQAFTEQKAIRKLYVISARMENDPAPGRPTLKLTIFSTKDDEDIFTTKIDVRDETGDLTTRNAQLYDAAIRRATYWLDNRWKEKVLVHFDSSSRLKIKIRLDRPKDWFTIRKKLENVSLIRHITYRKVTLEAVEMDMEYSGDIEQIILALDQKNLMMTKQSDDKVPVDYIPVLTLKK